MKHWFIWLTAAIAALGCSRRAEGLPFDVGAWQVVDAQVAALTLLTDSSGVSPAVARRLQAYRGVVYDFGADRSAARISAGRREAGQWLPDRAGMLVLKYEVGPPEAWQVLSATDDTLKVVSRAGLVLRFTLVRD